VPAPAVIPAPRAYINAVAVKGFVVELRAAKETDPSHPPDRRPLLLQPVNVRNKHRGSVTPRTRIQRMQRGARVSYCD
jgi:hypothetical protein